jgi:hypothetical protein
MKFDTARRKPAQQQSAVRWPPLLLGAFFTLVTGYLLFNDVIAGAPVTTTHVLSLAGLVAALGTGHLAIPEFRRGNIVSGLVLLILFAAATGYTVISAASRNSETAHGKVEATNSTASARKRAEADYAALHDELDDLAGTRTTQQVKAAMNAVKIPVWAFKDTKECTDLVPGSVEHKLCAPILTLRLEMAAAIRKADLELRQSDARARLDKFPPVVAANTGYHDAALVLATAGLVKNTDADIDRATDALALLLPFLIVLITEGCTIIFLHMGLPASLPAQVLPPPLPLMRRRRLVVTVQAALPAPDRPAERPEPATPDRPEVRPEPTSPDRPEVRTEPTSPDRPEVHTGLTSPDRPAGRPEPTSPDRPADRPEPTSPDRPADRPEPTSPERPADRSEPTSPDRPATLVASYVLAELAAHRTIPSQQELAHRLGIPRSTVSDILAEMEQRDQIHRRIDGKRKVIERPDYVLRLFRCTG